MTDDKKPPRKEIKISTENKSGESNRSPLRGRHVPKALRPGKPPMTAKPAPSAPTPRANPAEAPRRHGRPDAGDAPESHQPPPRHPARPRDSASSKLKSAEERGEREKQLLTFFAPCPRGLEEELARELTELGCDHVSAGRAGCHFESPMPQAWKVCLWSRLAIRVLWLIDHGTYQHEDDLYNAALTIPWTRWFTHDKTIALNTVAHDCPLQSLNFVTLRVKDAICDRFRADTGDRPSVETREPNVPILVYLDRDHYTYYIDLVGVPLNRRGYRIEPSAAPINENLAAGMLRLSGWQPDMPLLDPMMGGGTILLEAAMMALNQAPGLKRHFAFENLIGFRPDLWERITQQAERARKTPTSLPLYGLDIDPRMVNAAKINFRAASVGWCIQVAHGDALLMSPPAETGMIITNPPYGIRIGADADADATDTTAAMAVLYKGLGDALKKRFPGWTAWIITGDPDLPDTIGLKATRRTPLYNGALECRFLRYDMVAGQNRGQPPSKPT